MSMHDRRFLCLRLDLALDIPFFGLLAIPLLWGLWADTSASILAVPRSILHATQAMLSREVAWAEDLGIVLLLVASPSALMQMKLLTRAGLESLEASQYIRKLGERRCPPARAPQGLIEPQRLCLPLGSNRGIMPLPVFDGVSLCLVLLPLRPSTLPGGKRRRLHLRRLDADPEVLGGLSDLELSSSITLVGVPSYSKIMLQEASYNLPTSFG